MHLRYFSVLAVLAFMMIPTSAGVASTRPATSWVHTFLLPPGAAYTEASGEFTDGVGNPINSAGDVAANEVGPGQKCGNGHSFVYFPKAHQYVVMGNPPGMGTTDTETIGIAEDDSVAVYATPCSNSPNSIYQIGSVAATPQWSQPCTCAGYRPVGYNSDGIALNNAKLGPAILTFSNGTPTVTPLQINRGTRVDAHVMAVGTPAGFVGTQATRNPYHVVPTVWISGKPHVLPAVTKKGRHALPFAMVEHQTTGGLTIDIVGTYRVTKTPGYGDYYEGTDYWTGTPTANGFAFSEKRRFIKSPDIQQAWHMSTDGSAIFGSYYSDNDLVTYFTASHKVIYNSHGCGNNGDAWGDSHGDILVDGYCLAQPVH